MEASAMRARSRHDKRAAAARFERAAELTVEPRLRNARALAAAQAALAAGALGRAVALVDSTRPENFDELQRAEASRLRGMIGLARGQGTDRIRMLLGAARAFETLDRDLARDSYLEAIEAAVDLGRVGRGIGLREIAEAARARARSEESRARPADLLLDGLVLLITAGHGVAAPALRAAINAIREGDDSRWLALAAVAALEIWDNDGLHDLAAKIELAHGADPSLSPSGLEWIIGLDDVLAGRLAKTLMRTEGVEADVVDVLAAAWRGRSTEARELAETSMREAFARDRGLRVSAVHYALTLLETGLGRYEAALSAARDACEEPGLWIVTATLPELIEAAARSGEREVAAVALGTLRDRAIPAGSHWALGLLARSRALLAEGADADRLFADAIEHLRRSRIAPELARAHLLYGEWLRRERRRREAREELRTARDMFVFIGAQAFAARARRELAATGEHALRRADGGAGTDVVVEELLTPQELRIAYLARDGVSNADIAAELFISARTVEYHLHKVFRKLEVASRTQLARVLPEVEHHTQ
jgi:DNA-binding CsgD family transcriptional regulator